MAALFGMVEKPTPRQCHRRIAGPKKKAAATRRSLPIARYSSDAIVRGTNPRYIEKDAMADLCRESLRWTGCLCLAIWLSSCSLSPVWAVIETLTSLDKFVADADVILVANVKQLDLEKGRLVLAVESRLKGADSAATLPVKLAGNATETLLDVSPGATAVLFVSRGQQQDLAYGYVDGAWFHLIGTHDQDTVRWQFKAGEPYLRRTYADETTKLIAILTANIAGAGGLPVPDSTIPAGYGLIPGKHPARSQLSSANPSAAPASGGKDKPSTFQLNLPLTMAAAGCAIAFLIMLTRSQPLEDADG